MGRRFILSAAIALLLIFSASVLGETNPAEEHRIMQPITVNDQPGMGVLVVKVERRKRMFATLPAASRRIDRKADGRVLNSQQECG
jgi:hypothetical protein